MAKLSAFRPNLDEVQPAKAQEEQPTTAVTTTSNTLAKTAPAQPNQLQQLNQGVLENIDDINDSDCRFMKMNAGVFIDSQTETDYKELTIYIERGRRIYYYFDEVERKFHTADTKLDDRYKFGFNLWFVIADDNRDPDDFVPLYQMTLPPTSSMNFVQFARKLAKAGYGVNSVRVKMTTSVQRNADKQSYSRIEFEALDLETGEPIGIATDPKRSR